MRVCVRPGALYIVCTYMSQPLQWPQLPIVHHVCLVSHTTRVEYVFSITIKIKIKQKSSVHGCVWKLLWKEVSLHYVFVHGTCGFSLVHNLWDHRIFLCTNGNYVLNETMSRTLAIHYRVHLPCNQQILSIVHTSKLTLWYSGF